jgi:hypothetical protein
MSWSDYLGSDEVDDTGLDATAGDVADGQDAAYWADSEDQSAAGDALQADSYLGAAQQNISAGYDPSGDLGDAGAEAGYASDEELTASDLSGLASDDFSAADDVTAGGGDVWDPAVDA